MVNTISLPRLQSTTTTSQGSRGSIDLELTPDVVWVGLWLDFDCQTDAIFIANQRRCGLAEMTLHCATDWTASWRTGYDLRHPNSAATVPLIGQLHGARAMIYGIQIARRLCH